MLDILGGLVDERRLRRPIRHAQEIEKRAGSGFGTIAGDPRGAHQGQWALFAAEAVHEAHGNLPFVDMWWTFKAFDYLITYQLLDWLNPGYLRRYEQKQKRERGGMT